MRYAPACLLWLAVAVLVSCVVPKAARSPRAQPADARILRHPRPAPEKYRSLKT